MDASFLRGLGLCGAAATVLFLGWDMRQHAQSVTEAENTPVDFGPEGFSQNLGGIGAIETAVRGRVQWLAEKAVPAEDGSIAYESQFQIQGTDPLPVGTGMELKEAQIDTLQGQEFTVTAPSAWLPLTKERSRFTFDLKSLWQLRKPVFVMKDFHDGHPLTIRTDDADLDPATNQIYGRGPFTLDSDSLHLEGSDLYFDPARSRVEFQPHNGVISWSIRGRNGEIYEGVSDGPGAFSPVGEDGQGYLLELHAHDLVRSTFPEASRMPGTLDTRDFFLYLKSSKDDDWRLDYALADGPTIWSGSRLQMNGGNTRVDWREDGDDLDTLTIAGKVHVVPHDESFAWAEAEDRAILHGDRESVRLEGDVSALHSRGILLGDWAELGQESWELGGHVFAIGEDGMAAADRVYTNRQGDWWLEGNAELRPADSDIEWIRSPAIHFTEDGRVETHDGFQLEAMVDGAALLGSGQHLLSLPEPAWGDERKAERRTVADGNLVVIHGDRTLRGHQLTQTGPQSFRIEGKAGQPVIGTHLERGHEIQLEAGRVEWNGQSAVLEESPSLRVPAALMDLQGDYAVVHADRFVQDATTGGWDLLGNVRFTEALAGGADEGHWLPDEEIRLVRSGRLVDGKRETAKLAGTRLDGTQWSTSARELQLLPDGSLHLQDEAYASIWLPGDERATEVWGDQLDWSEQAGRVEGKARFDGPQATGHANLLVWTRHEDGEHHLFELEGDAVMQQGMVHAEGDRLSLDTGTANMTAIGNATKPARLRAKDGRTAVGEWLRYNLDNGSFDAHGARFETP